MAEERFSGAVAKRGYRWGYVCEFCGKTIEKESYISTKHGIQHGWKTTAYADKEQKEALKKEALSDLSILENEMNNNLKEGKFSAPQDDHGRCPECKRYQHWSSHMESYLLTHDLNDESKNKRTDSISFFEGCCGVFLILCVCMIPSIIAMIFKASLTLDIILLIAGIILTIALSLLGNRLLKKGDKRELEDARKLQTLEKKEPYFIEWGDYKVYTTGL